MAPAGNAIHGSVRPDTCITTKLGSRLTPLNTRQACACEAAHKAMKLAQLSEPTVSLQMDHACSTATNTAGSNLHCKVYGPSRSPMPSDANQSLSEHACMCYPSVQSCSGTLSIGASASQPCTLHQNENMMLVTITARIVLYMHVIQHLGLSDSNFVGLGMRDIRCTPMLICRPGIQHKESVVNCIQ